MRKGGQAALTPHPGRMPARRLVWMTGLTIQTRLRENPDPLAFKGLAGRRPLGNARNAAQSPRHGSGACRGYGRDRDNPHTHSPLLPTTAGEGVIKAGRGSTI